MIGLDGEKMTKSRGNLVFVSRLRGDGVDPMAIRLALLRATTAPTGSGPATCSRPPRSGWPRGAAPSPCPPGRPRCRCSQRVRERLADDLDSPGALACVDEWARATLEGGSPDGGSRDGGAQQEDGAPALVRDAVDALLGVALQP